MKLVVKQSERASFKFRRNLAAYAGIALSATLAVVPLGASATAAPSDDAPQASASTDVTKTTASNVFPSTPPTRQGNVITVNNQGGTIYWQWRDLASDTWGSVGTTYTLQTGETRCFAPYPHWGTIENAAESRRCFTHRVGTSPITITPSAPQFSELHGSVGRYRVAGYSGAFTELDRVSYQVTGDVVFDPYYLARATGEQVFTIAPNTTVTVTATPAPGHVFAAGATRTWTYTAPKLVQPPAINAQFFCDGTFSYGTSGGEGYTLQAGRYTIQHPAGFGWYAVTPGAWREGAGEIVGITLTASDGYVVPDGFWDHPDWPGWEDSGGGSSPVGNLQPPFSVAVEIPYAGQCSPIFADVPEGVQFRDEIMWLASNGVTTGWGTEPSREYRPLTEVKRDAMAAFLYRLAGSPPFTPPARSPFRDVATSNQFYKEISWLASRGISAGWDVAGQPGVKDFRPLTSVNRDAMAAFLYRFSNSPAYTAPTTARFADVADTTQFYKEISWLADEAISTGWGTAPNAEYRPVLPVNRDAMAAFMYRLIN